MKKTTSNHQIQNNISENIVESPISDVLTSNYMPYAMSVIVSRALPEIDGFKPAHRKLLYTMYLMGLLSSGRTKSANVVGQTMKLNPHGDSSIYETMVRLAKNNESLLFPYVDSKGNFGKHYSRDMSYAASRYTEVKLMPICHELFGELDKNAIDFIDNYDGTMKEPSLLPVTFPSILVNPTMGIAVSMASNICSFNLQEICQATIQKIKKPKSSISNIIEIPDFPTGGDIVYSKKNMDEIIETGKGSFKVRGRYRNNEKANTIEIYEIPYSTTAEAIIDGIVDLVKKGILKCVNNVRDETDLNGLRIAIEYKKGTDIKEMMSIIYQQTPFEDSFGCNFNILVNGKPKVMGVGEILSSWLDWRRKCVTRTIEFDKKNKEQKLHLLEGLQKILLNVNKAIKIIKDTSDDSLVVPNLMSAFKIDEVQGEFVSNIRLRNLNKDYILNKTNEISSLTSEIAKLNALLSSDKKIDSLIIRQLESIMKKYGQPRKTGKIDESTISKVVVESKSGSSPSTIIVTKAGYIRAIPDKCSIESLKIKDGDAIQHIYKDVNCNDMILIFTTERNVYKLKASDVKKIKASDLGDYLPNVANFQPDETIVDTVLSDEKSTTAAVVLGFANGKMVKIPMSSYYTKQYRKKLINAVSSVAPLVFVSAFSENNLYYAYGKDYNVGAIIPAKIISCNASKSSSGAHMVKSSDNINFCILPDEFKGKKKSSSYPTTLRKMN